MKTYYYLLIFFFLYGCANEKKLNVEYVSATYELLDDEIATTMPGTLRVAGDFLVWEDPFARDYFVHVHEKETGRKVGVMGKVGEGPREFITGGINGSCIDNCFFAVDANGKTRGFLSLDSLSQSKDAFIPMTEEERLSRPAMLNMPRMCILELRMLVRNIVLKLYCMVRLLRLAIIPFRR